MPATQSERLVTIDGIRTRCIEAGCDKPDSVLFIHGLGSSADRWLDIPLALSLDYHTVAIDLPGFGMADKPESGFGYSIAEYAGFVVHLAKELSLGKVSLVGHSLGGYVAAELAIGQPSLVQKLVLIDTSGMLDGPTELLKRYHSAAMDPTRASVRPVLEQLVAHPSRIADILVDGFIYRMGLPGAKHAFSMAYEKSVHTQLGRDRLQKISAPTFIVWGSQDRLIPISFQPVFAGAISGSISEVVDDAGHAPFAEKPALSTELVRRFLAG